MTDLAGSFLFELDVMFEEGRLLSETDFLQLADLPPSLAVRHGVHEAEFSPGAAIVQRICGSRCVNVCSPREKFDELYVPSSINIRWASGCN